MKNGIQPPFASSLSLVPTIVIRLPGATTPLTDEMIGWTPCPNTGWHRHSPKAIRAAVVNFTASSFHEEFCLTQELQVSCHSNQGTSFFAAEYQGQLVLSCTGAGYAISPAHCAIRTNSRTWLLSCWVKPVQRHGSTITIV